MEKSTEMAPRMSSTSTPAGTRISTLPRWLAGPRRMPQGSLCVVVVPAGHRGAKAHIKRRAEAVDIDPMEIVDDDRQLRAMVSLIEAQAEQVATLRAAVDKLEGLLALRSELDTMVAHEVRSPLTVIHGVLSTLQVLPDGHADRNELVSQALDHTRRLSESLKHLLSPAGEPAPVVDRAVLEPVAFEVIADRLLDEVGRRDGCSGAHVVVDAQLDLVVTTSPPRLEALLLHLLEHAAERSPDGV